MKKLIIIGIVVLLVIVGYFFLKKKSTSIFKTTDNLAPAPGVVLKPGSSAPSGTDEQRVISHMAALNSSDSGRVSSTRVSLGFSSQNQALAYLAITEGKSVYKDVSSNYAGSTNSEVAIWVKKYVQ